jgi:hypothetical protein
MTHSRRPTSLQTLIWPIQAKGLSPEICGGAGLTPRVTKCVAGVEREGNPGTKPPRFPDFAFRSIRATSYKLARPHDVRGCRARDRCGPAPACGSSKDKVAGCQCAGEADEGDSVGCGSRRADDGVWTTGVYDEIVEIRDTRNLELHCVLALAEIVYEILPECAREHEGIVAAGDKVGQDLRITPHAVGGVDTADEPVVAALGRVARIAR